MTSGSDRMAEAREINANLPVEIQKAFNDNSINYYHPGIGEFYYNKMCGDTDCSIVQVAKSCDCYVSGSDQQLHYLTFGEDGNLEKSIFNSQANLPPATKHSVNSGDTLFAIAERYGVDLSIILGANKDITNPDVIAVGQVIQIPSQAYKVVEGDYLDAIAKNYGVSLSALKALNGQIENHDLIFPGQMIRVPPKRLGDPFSTTVESGDSLSSIADKWGVSLASVEALNPEIEDKDLIFPNQVVKISLYMPVQGNLTTTNSCPTCEADEKAAALTGAKFARAVTAPKLIATTIEVGPTATPIVAKVPAVSGSKGFVENNSWVGKASRQLFRLI
ncbi:carbohydrate-binding module family 50 protein [Stipitochalara longipes BDJ]|nr:carbohydrate-binding module family 50 protein [Stipitochalara longipes BDJ]